MVRSLAMYLYSVSKGASGEDVRYSRGILDSLDERKGMMLPLFSESGQYTPGNMIPKCGFAMKKYSIGVRVSFTSMQRALVGCDMSIITSFSISTPP